MSQATVLLAASPLHLGHCVCCEAEVNPDNAAPGSPEHCIDCLLQICCGDDADAFLLPPEGELPVCRLCGRLFEPEYAGEAVCNGWACDGRDWPPPAADVPLGVPCPRRYDGTPF